MRILHFAVCLGLLASVAPVAAASHDIPFDEQLPDGLGVDAGAIVAAMNRHVDTVQGVVQSAGNGMGTQPGVFAVSTTHGALCPTEDTFQCRVVSGRPVTGGALEMCSERRPQNALAYDAAHVVDAFVGQFLVGTPAEGEGICTDHWAALYHYATIP